MLNAIVTAGNQKAETHAEGPGTLSVTPGVATHTATKVGFVDLNQPAQCSCPALE